MDDKLCTFDDNSNSNLINKSQIVKYDIKKEEEDSLNQKIQNEFQLHFRASSQYRKKVPAEYRKRIEISDSIKYQILNDQDNKVSQDDLASKYGVEKHYLQGLVSRRMYNKDLPLFSPKNINRARKVDSTVMQLIKDVCLRLQPKNSIKNVQNQLQDNYSSMDLSKATISYQLRQMGMSFSKRNNTWYREAQNNKIKEYQESNKDKFKNYEEANKEYIKNLNKNNRKISRDKSKFFLNLKDQEINKEQFKIKSKQEAKKQMMKYNRYNKDYYKAKMAKLQNFIQKNREKTNKDKIKEFQEANKDKLKNSQKELLEKLIILN